MIVLLFFKEKKERAIHDVLDPENGRELVSIYEEMDKHPSIYTNISHSDKYLNNRFIGETGKLSTSEIIEMSDLIISFPFTSTTFEALSMHKNAIWHDPQGLYRDTPYGSIKNLTTHDRNELMRIVKGINNRKAITNKPVINASNRDLFDPYMDRRAVERFIQLLSAN